MIVQVTQEDIDNGEIYQPTKCALALALRRVFGPTVQVGVEVFAIGLGGNGKQIKLPEKAIDFRRDFDHFAGLRPRRHLVDHLLGRPAQSTRRHLKPFEFEVEG